MTANRTFVLALLAAPALVVAAPGRASAADPAPASPGAGDTGLPRLGLEPGEPQVRSAAPALPFGINPAASKEYVLDFHGYFLLPARLGVHTREMPTARSPSTFS